MHAKTEASTTRSDTSHASAYALLALAVLCWAGNFVTGRALRDDVPPVALTFWRWTVAALVLMPFTYASLRTRWRVILRDWKIITLLALFATVLQHIPYYWGLSQTSATNAALLNSASPMFILLLSVLLLHERLSAMAWIGTIISFAGVVVIVSQGDVQRLAKLTLNTGDIWVLAGTFSWGAYTVCLRWRPRALGGLDLLALVAVCSVILLAPLYAIETASGKHMNVSTPSIVGILYVGVVASVLAYVGWNRGVAKVGPARAGPFMYLMLFYTPLLSIAFLGEAVQFYHLIGAALIVAGIYVATARGLGVQKA